MTAIPASIDLRLLQRGSLYGDVQISGWKPDQADLYVFRYPGNRLIQRHEIDYAYQERGEASHWQRSPYQRVLGTSTERALFKIVPLDTFRGALCPVYWGTQELRAADARLRTGDGGLPDQCQRADYTDVVALANGTPLRRLGNRDHGPLSI